MAAAYRAVMLTKKGGPEVLQIVELPVEAPSAGQLRVRVRAAGVGSSDLMMLMEVSIVVTVSVTVVVR